MMYMHNTRMVFTMCIYPLRLSQFVYMVSDLVSCTYGSDYLLGPLSPIVGHIHPLRLFPGKIPCTTCL